MRHKNVLILIACIFTVKNQNIIAKEIDLQHFSVNIINDYEINKFFISGFRIENQLGKFVFFAKDEDYNFGCEVNTNSLFKDWHFILRMGNLTATEGYSKLKNPMLNASLSPFFLGLKKSTPITTLLPSYTSFSKPITIFAQLGTQNIQVNIFYNPEEHENIFSGILKIKLADKRFLWTSINSGFFSYSQNNNSSWYLLDYPFYHQGIQFSGNAMFSFTSPHVNLLFIPSFYQNPWNQIFPTFRIEGNLKLFLSNYSIQAFYNPSNMTFTANGNFIAKTFQIKMGIQHVFDYKYRNISQIKNGISVYYKNNFSDQTKNDLKVSFGSNIYCQNLYVSLIFNLNYLTDMQVQEFVWATESLSGKVIVGIYLDLFNPYITAKLTYTPKNQSSDYVIKHQYIINLKYYAFPYINLSNGLEITNENKKISKIKYDLGLNSAFLYKRIKYIIKFSGTLQSHRSA